MQIIGKIFANILKWQDCAVPICRYCEISRKSEPKTQYFVQLRRYLGTSVVLYSYSCGAQAT